MSTSADSREAGAVGDWQQFEKDDGSPFWVNLRTGVSVRTPPTKSAQTVPALPFSQTPTRAQPQGEIKGEAHSAVFRIGVDAEAVLSTPVGNVSWQNEVIPTPTRFRLSP